MSGIDSDAVRFDFCDVVRVRRTPVTIDAGVEVIGDANADRAINVLLEGRAETLWFAPGLLELVSHNAGSEVRFRGTSKRWTKTEDGDWIEDSVTDSDA